MAAKYLKRHGVPRWWQNEAVGVVAHIVSMPPLDSPDTLAYVAIEKECGVRSGAAHERIVPRFLPRAISMAPEPAFMLVEKDRPKQ